MVIITNPIRTKTALINNALLTASRKIKNKKMIIILTIMMHYHSINKKSIDKNNEGDRFDTNKLAND